jgi:hypothetical protein
MSNNLTNSMISILTTVKQYDDINKNDKYIDPIFQVDIKTIVTNAKNDKRFHKLLSLCIKYDIHLFNQYNDVCTLLSIDNLLLQANEKQKFLTKELSEKINEISKNGPVNTWLLDIENTYTQYKKIFKEIEIIDYVLKNIYNDKQLEELCCIKNTNNISSQNNTTNLSNTISPNTNLTNTNLTNTNLTNTTTTNTISPNTNLTNTISPNTNLTNTNLINTNLTNTNLTNTNSSNSTNKVKNSERNKKEKLSKYIAVYSN